MKRGLRDLTGGQQTVALKKGAVKAKTSATQIDVEEIRARIAAKAYELYEKRGCTHGSDREDWFEAERLVMSQSKSAAK